MSVRRTSELDKLDTRAVNGLEGVADSLSYKVEEIERHFHNREFWFGVAATPAAETHVADIMSGTIQPFQLTAGDNTWGNWVQVLGSSDTPIASGVKFDAHRFMVTTTNSTNPYVLQIVAGESAGIAAKLTAKEYSLFPYVSSSNNNDSGVEDVMTVRVLSTTKIWARCACVGGNGTTISFYFGIHEYEG